MKVLVEFLFIIKEYLIFSDVWLKVLYGVWFCGMCFGSVGMLLYYKFCYIFGGSFNLFYVEIYMIVLFYVFVYNVFKVLEVMVVLVIVLLGSNGDVI